MRSRTVYFPGMPVKSVLYERDFFAFERVFVAVVDAQRFDRQPGHVVAALVAGFGTARKAWKFKRKRPRARRRGGVPASGRE